MGNTVHFCNNGTLADLPCGAGGTVCALENATVGYNCISTTCSSLPAGGHCTSATHFEYCSPDGAVTDNCAQSGGSCGTQNGVVGCMAGCGSVTFYGECSGNVLTYCLSGANNQSVVTTDCALNARTCSLVDTTHGYDCVGGAGCGTVTADGHCVGSRLERCVEGALLVTDCGAMGGECVYNSSRGYMCVGAPGARTVTGRVTYDKRPATTGGLGAAQPVGVPNVLVEAVVAGSNQVVGFTYTYGDGNYSLSFDAMQVFRVRVVSRNTSSTYPIDVHDPQGSAYAVSSADQDATSTQLTVDVNVSQANGSGAFNIFAQLVKGFDFIGTTLFRVPIPLEAEWQAGVTPPCGTSCYSSRDTRIYVLSTAADTDEFDDTVLLHEFGHYMSDKFSRDDSPGGSHDGSPTDPRMAWGEGYGTFVGCSVSQNPLYIDTNPGGANVTDLEDTGRAPHANPGGTMRQPIGEYLVAEVLWDITDAQNDTGDTISMGPTPVFDVLSHYFTSSAFADRGVTGVDLVDFLDGWFCRGHGQTAGIQSIVTTTRGFPYDFQAPLSCP